MIGLKSLFGLKETDITKHYNLIFDLHIQELKKITNSLMVETLLSSTYASNVSISDPFVLPKIHKNMNVKNEYATVQAAACLAYMFIRLAGERYTQSFVQTNEHKILEATAVRTLTKAEEGYAASFGYSFNKDDIFKRIEEIGRQMSKAVEDTKEELVKSSASPLNPILSVISHVYNFHIISHLKRSKEEQGAFQEILRKATEFKF